MVELQKLPKTMVLGGKEMMQERMTTAEYRKRIKNGTLESGSGEKKSKMNNKKVDQDGITFDSKKECKRYNQLRMLQRVGEISGLELQPVYELQPAFKKNLNTYQAIKYLPDFKYTKNGQTIIEDVKASAYFKTDVYKMKRKMFEYRYPELTIVEVYEA